MSWFHFTGKTDPETWQKQAGSSFCRVLYLYFVHVKANESRFRARCFMKLGGLDLGKT